jgi:predicted dienelactone hydrolase
VLAAEATKAIPVAHYAMIEDASHFSMFAACKPGASAIAESETIGDPICMDGGGWPRNAIHAQLIDMGGAAFGRALKAE